MIHECLNILYYTIVRVFLGCMGGVHMDLSTIDVFIIRRLRLAAVRALLESWELSGPYLPLCVVGAYVRPCGEVHSFRFPRVALSTYYHPTSDPDRDDPQCVIILLDVGPSNRLHRVDQSTLFIDDIPYFLGYGPCPPGHRSLMAVFRSRFTHQRRG